MEVHDCGCLSCGEGSVEPLLCGFLFEHVPFLNYASTGKTQ